MELDLKDKVALVTGSSRGLGFCIAQKLAEEGAHVLVNGRSEVFLQELKEKYHWIGDVYSADVRCPDQAEQLLANVASDFGRLDVLVTVVGSGSSVQPGSETPEEWERMLKLNLFSAVNVISAARSLLSKSEGTVVCISSICGQQIFGAPIIYSAAKSALNHYIRGIARVLAGQGIRINGIAPGNLIYDGSVWQKRLAQDPDAVTSLLQTQVPLGRLGLAEEIADWVLFLASKRSSFATGQIFTVDGGQVSA